MVIFFLVSLIFDEMEDFLDSWGDGVGLLVKMKGVGGYGLGESDSGDGIEIVRVEGES